MGQLRGPIAPANRDPELSAALAEASAARLARGLASISDGLSRLCVDAPGDPLAEYVGRARSALRMEELALAAGETIEEGAALLKRFLFAQQQASPVARALCTSFGADDLGPDVLATVLAVLAELVAMVEIQTAACTDIRMYVASAWHEDGIVIAFAARGLESWSIGRDARVCLERARRLLKLVQGTLVTGESDGMHVVGVLVPPGGPASV